MKKTQKITQSPDYYVKIYKSSIGRLFYRPKIDKIISSIPRERCCVLDAGCGSGVLLFLLKKRKKSKIYGIDTRKECVEFASKFCKTKNIHYGDLRNLKINKKFDVITCIDVIEHFSSKQQLRVIKKLDKHLKKNGIMVLSYPSIFYLKILEKIWRPIRKILYPRVVFDDEFLHEIVKENEIYSYLNKKGYDIKTEYACFYLTKIAFLVKN